MECVRIVDRVVSVASFSKLFDLLKFRWWQLAMVLTYHKRVPREQATPLIVCINALPCNLVVRPQCEKRE